MEKEVKLGRKIKRFLRRIGCPRFLHHFGPKRYELNQHLFALLMMEAFQLSLRRAEKLLTALGINQPILHCVNAEREYRRGFGKN
jgi:hypothetical protein